MTFYSVEEANRYLSSFCDDKRLSDAECFRLKLVTEELASNMFKYTDARYFTLTLTQATPIEVTLSYLAEKFDLPPQRIELKPLSQMQEGGLGLFLAQKMTRRLDYRHDNGKTVYTFTL